MRRLILIRHAKSDWGRGLPDHDRPLNARGRRAAPAIGAWLKDRAFHPGQILCSTATRTRETLDLLDMPAPTRFETALYHAAPDSMLTLLKTAQADSVMMLGHNPGIAVFAASLLRRPPDHPRFDAYPTCAALVADFDIDDWTHLRPGTGTPTAFIVPRDLSD